MSQTESSIPGVVSPEYERIYYPSCSTSLHMPSKNLNSVLLPDHILNKYLMCFPPELLSIYRDLKFSIFFSLYLKKFFLIFHIFFFTFSLHLKKERGFYTVFLPWPTSPSPKLKYPDAYEHLFLYKRYSILSLQLLPYVHRCYLWPTCSFILLANFLTTYWFFPPGH